MFKIFAIIMLSINGVPQDEPLEISHTAKFATLADCTAFKDGDNGAKALVSLNALLDMRLPENVKREISTVCRQTSGDDGSI